MKEFEGLTIQEAKRKMEINGKSVWQRNKEDNLYRYISNKYDNGFNNFTITTMELKKELGSKITRDNEFYKRFVKDVELDINENENRQLELFTIRRDKEVHFIIEVK